MEEIFGALERPDNRRLGPFNDAEDFSLGPPVASRASMVAWVAEETRHDSVAVQRGAEMVGGDEEIFSPLFLGKDMAGASGMNLELACEEIGRLWHDVVIPANTGQLTLALQ